MTDNNKETTNRVIIDLLHYAIFIYIATSVEKFNSKPIIIHNFRIETQF